MEHVYLDHNATTQLDGAVLEAMLPWLQAQQGNPTSRHKFGRNARDAVELARSQVADACGAYPAQVVFTSSGTEANNFAVKGIAPLIENGQTLTSAIEHPCVTNPALYMQRFGHRHATIAVDNQGVVDMPALAQQLKTPTSLVSVMLANNETGVVQEIETISALARKQGAFMHTDAVQMLGKDTLDFTALNVHAMTVSSHKVHGPQGAAALILDKRVDITPLLHGGGQERNLRSGTENVAALVGFGVACTLANARVKDKTTKIKALRDQFESGLAKLSEAHKITVFGQQTQRLANTSYFAVNSIEGETLVTALDKQGYAIASGSACSSDSDEPSHVLMAMGITPDVARGAVRISFGAENTTAQVVGLLQTLEKEIVRLKQMMSIAA